MLNKSLIFLIVAGFITAFTFALKRKPLGQSSAVVESQSLPIVAQAPGVVSTRKTISYLNVDRSNIVPIMGPIDETAGRIAQYINALSETGRPMYVLINSPGGSVLDGSLIVSAIQASRVPVYTVCLQLCASQAAIIFEYGTKRLMVDRSVLMFHNAAGGVQGTFPQMKTRLALFDRYVNKMLSDIAKRVGLTLPEFAEAISGELWLDAEDAKQQRYSDAIVSVNIDAQAIPTDPDSAANFFSQTKTLNNKFQINLGN